MANVIEFSVKALDEFSATFSKLDSSMGQIKGAFNAVIASAPVAALVASQKAALDLADSMGKAAQKAGVSVETFSGLAAAAGMSDVSVQGLQLGLKNLSQAVVKSADATSAEAKQFQALGVAVRDANGAMLPTDKILLSLSDKFAGAEDNAAKTAIAVKLFGKAGIDLIPFLNEGSAGINELTAKMESLGLVITDDVAKGADEVNDNIDMMGKAMQGASTQVMAAMLPTFKSLSKVFMDTATDGKNMQMVADGIAFALKSVVSIGIGVVTTFKVLGTRIAGFAAAIAFALKGEWAMAADALNNSLDDTRAIVDQSAKMINDVWTPVVQTATAATKSATGANKDKKDSLKAVNDELDKNAQKVQELIRGLQVEVTQARAGEDQDKKWTATLEKLNTLKAGPEAIERAKSLSEEAFQIDRAAKATEQHLAQMEKDAEIRQANLGPMQQYEASIAAINRQLDQNLISEDMAQVKRQEASNSALQAAASTQYLTGINASAVDTMEAKFLAAQSNMGSFSVQVGEMMFSAMNNMVAGIGNAVAQAIVMGASLSDMMKNVLKQVASQIISTLIQIGIQRLILATIFQGTNMKQASSSMATGLADVYLRSFASAAAIPVVGWAIAPGVATANTILAAGGAVAAGGTGAGLGAAIGASHGGLGYVPEESTYLLSAGERVLSPRQNRDLTDYLGQGGSSGGSVGTVNIHILENATSADVFARMNRVELRQTLGQPVVDALNEMFRVGVKPDFATVAS